MPERGLGWKELKTRRPKNEKERCRLGFKKKCNLNSNPMK